MNKNTKKDFLKSLVETTRAQGLVPSLYSRSSYCMSVDDNIYQNSMAPIIRAMFLNGSGNELTGKACAIHSSSMFAYNFYHWISKEHPLIFQDKYELTQVYFEVQIPTLIGTTPANMDVVLEGVRISDNKPVLLFIESKFTEHFSNGRSDMKEMANNSYSKKQDKYFDHNRQSFESWKKIISKFADLSQSENGYYDGIKQEICHMIALTNLLNDDEARQDYEKRYKDKDVEHPTITGKEIMLFYNILFDASDDFNESDAYNKYKELYMCLDKELADMKSGIESGILSYRTIYDSIPDDRLKDYLYKRYMQFAK